MFYLERAKALRKCFYIINNEGEVCTNVIRKDEMCLTFQHKTTYSVIVKKQMCRQCTMKALQNLYVNTQEWPQE